MPSVANGSDALLLLGGLADALVRGTRFHPPLSPPLIHFLAAYAAEGARTRWGVPRGKLFPLGR